MAQKVVALHSFHLQRTLLPNRLELHRVLIQLGCAGGKKRHNQGLLAKPGVLPLNCGGTPAKQHKNMIFLILWLFISHLYAILIRYFIP